MVLEARAVVADFLKKVVAVCAEGPRQSDLQLAVGVVAFRVPEALTSRSGENWALSSVLDGAKALADCLRAVYLEHPEDCRRHAVDTALHAVCALILECGSPLFESSEAAKSLHAEQLRDLEALARVGPATPFDLGDTGPFGPLWKAETPGSLAGGKVAWDGEILAELKTMPAKSSVLVSAEFSHAPADVYAELRMPKKRGRPASGPKQSSKPPGEVVESVVADLKALKANCVQVQEQIVALVQERLDALASRTFGSFAANKEVVDEINAVIEGHGICLLYAGPKKEHFGKAVSVRVYDHPETIGGQFFVRLSDARATKISGGTGFPKLKAIAGGFAEQQGPFSR
jgi:hypothetical protein